VGATRTRRHPDAACAIETTALGLFAAHGFDSVTVDQIAAAVGVHPRTVARYFPSKDDIVLAYPRRIGAGIRAELERRPLDESPFDALCEAVTATVQHAALAGDVEALTWGRAALSRPEILLFVSTEQDEAIADVLAARLAPRLGASVARTLAGAVVGAMHAIWRQSLDDDGVAQDFPARLREGFRTLEGFVNIDARGGDRIAELQAEVESLRVERELFRRAAEAMLVSTPAT
jgi:AcrR family transcriptional regulator